MPPDKAFDTKGLDMAFKTPSYSAYRNNPLSAWYWEHGGEEIIGPLGPYGAHIANAVAQANVDPHPWRIAIGQLVQACRRKISQVNCPRPNKSR